MSMPQGGGVGFQNVATLVANTVEIIAGTGSSSGLFVYNGTPALGNPPILAIVAPGTTQDPFGNTVQAVLNIGNIAAGHAGFDGSGNEYLADSTGKVRIELEPSNHVIALFDSSGAGINPPLLTVASASGTTQYGTTFPGGIALTGLPFLVYSGTPAAGNLVASLSPNAGSDVFGNGFLAGVNIYSTTPGINAVTSGVLVGGLPSWAFFSGAASEATEAYHQAGVTNRGGATEQIFNVLNGPKSTVSADFVSLQMFSSALTLPNVATLYLVYTDSSAGIHRYLSIGQNGVGGVGVLSAPKPGVQPVTVDTWNNMALTNSWSNTAGGSPSTARYKMLPFSDASALQPRAIWVQGDISHASTSGNSAFFTMPTGYIPAQPQADALGLVVATAVYPTATATWFLGIDTSGGLTAHGLPSGTTRVTFNAIFALD